MTEWKPVSGWPYEVSDAGAVRNTRTGRVLRQFMHKSGYLQVQLWNRGKFCTVLVHRVAACAFLGFPPSGEHEVAHLDGNRQNNEASNLKWVLHSENMAHRDLHGTTARGKRNGKCLHDSSVVTIARELHAKGIKPQAIAEELGISKNTISGYIYGKRRQILDDGEHRQ